jgi:hypothetical protein
MTLDELINSARSILDDEVGEDSENLWSDIELTEYINDAIYNLCRRTHRLIVDSTTAAICQIAVVAGTNLYTLSPRILEIQKARLPSTTNYVRPVALNILDQRQGWEVTTGTPTYYCLDYQTGSIMLYPIPIVTETMYLTVYRLPVTDLVYTTATASPEIPVQYHQDLLPWVYYKAYTKNDVETANKLKSAEWKQIADVQYDKIYREYLRKVPSQPCGTMYGAL